MTSLKFQLYCLAHDLCRILFQTVIPSVVINNSKLPLVRWGLFPGGTDSFEHLNDSDWWRSVDFFWWHLLKLYEPVKIPFYKRLDLFEVYRDLLNFTCPQSSLFEVQ